MERKVNRETSFTWIRYALLIAACALILLFHTTNVHAAYREVNTTKTKYGNYYVWKSGYSFCSLYVQKAGSSSRKTVQGSYGTYVIDAFTNGYNLIYSVLPAKHDACTIYIYNLVTGKKTTYTSFKTFLNKTGIPVSRICGVYGKYIYIAGVNDNYYGTRHTSYKYVMSNFMSRIYYPTKKVTKILNNFIAVKQVGNYIYGTRTTSSGGTVYRRYNMATGKLSAVSSTAYYNAIK